MRAIGYTRVSTDEQAERGVSLDAQRERLEAYCKLYSIDLSEIVADAGKSAKNLDRPGMQRILEMIRKRDVDAVVVAKLDRLTRSVRDLADLMDPANKRGVSLISVAEHLDTGSAAGRMVVNMLGTVSQWEREAIGERTATALQFKKRNGQRYNRHALYGFRHEEGRLVPCESEQRTIARIVHYHDQRLTLRAVARRLNADGILTRCGGAWTGEQVGQVVKHAPDRAALAETARAALVK